MKAFPLDRRQRNFGAFDRGTQTQKQVAERFSVSESRVKKFLRQGGGESGDTGTRQSNCSALKKVLAGHGARLRELLGGGART